MSEGIWVALIGAAAAIAAACIQAYRGRHPSVAKTADGSERSVALPDSESLPARRRRVPPQPIPVAPGFLAIEEAITELEAQGGQRSATARAGHSYYETASKLRFVPGLCASADDSYNCREYIARNARGTCYSISLNLNTGKITCGPKGYHYSHTDVAECI